MGRQKAQISSKISLVLIIIIERTSVS